MSKIYYRDKGARGNSNDFDARQKKKAKRDFKFIHLIISPDSEYSEFPQKERIYKAMDALGYSLKELQEDKELEEAITEYQSIFDSIPSVRAYNAAKNSYDKKIEYINNIDFNEEDKTGKKLYTPSEHSKTLTLLNEDLRNLKELQERMMDDVTTEKLKFKKSTVFSEEDELAMTSPQRNIETNKFY